MKTKLLFMVMALAVQALFAVELLAPPQALKDAEGRVETGLVDPFARPSDRGDPAAAENKGEGFLRTSLGEISTEFKILGIVVPSDTNHPPTAVLQLNGKAEPVVVHPGDTVRIENAEETSRNRKRMGNRVAPKSGLSLDDRLKDYMFYLYIKEITATHLEVYHNKKRPDETIILNW